MSYRDSTDSIGLRLHAKGLIRHQVAPPHLEGFDSSLVGFCNPGDTVDSQHPTRLERLFGMPKKNAPQKGGGRARHGD